MISDIALSTGLGGAGGGVGTATFLLQDHKMSDRKKMSPKIRMDWVMEYANVFSGGNIYANESEVWLI